MHKKLKILFLASETAPIAKTGGLADVAGALPIALHDLGCDVRVVMPYYRQIKDKGVDAKLILQGVGVNIGRLRLVDDIYQAYLKDKVALYLVHKEEFFDRNYLYGTPQNEYFDNAERFVYLTRAALEYCRRARFAPDIIHCNDWHTALAPVYLKTCYRDISEFKKTRSVLTIHNLAYQGQFDAGEFSTTGLPNAVYAIDGIEFWGKINFLKAGILFSDAITTVSKQYREEMQTPEFGHGLDGVLRQRNSDLYGILNGVDYSEWDPAIDPLIAKHYSLADLSGKNECKKDIVSSLHLEQSYAQRPILAMINRLTEQKGCDLVSRLIDRLVQMGVGLVLLGEGEEKYNEMFGAFRRLYAGKAGIVIGYNHQLAHRIIAGADMLLMPSRYEPCGLTQMYALKYGAVPIVRDVGGLSDTISEFNPETGEGTGFKFKDYSEHALMETIEHALKCFQDVQLWDNIMRNGMKVDFTWDNAAREYMKIYEKVMKF
ncbi:MAG: glycogen synthase GlgA [Pseudomonadota bacterium]